MKKTILFLSALVLFAVPGTIKAASETAVSSELVTPLKKNAIEDSFRLTVTGDGRLVTKPGPVFTEGGNYENIQLPYLISTPKPIAYPRWAVRQGWQGELVLALEVLPNGNVGRMQVMQSTGYSMLDKIGEQAVGTWRFRPATENGKPVVTCIQIPIVFQLEQG